MDLLNDYHKIGHKIRCGHVVAPLTTSTIYNHNSGLNYSHMSKTTCRFQWFQWDCKEMQPHLYNEIITHWHENDFTETGRLIKRFWLDTHLQVMVCLDQHCWYHIEIHIQNVLPSYVLKTSELWNRKKQEIKNIIVNTILVMSLCNLMLMNQCSVQILLLP